LAQGKKKINPKALPKQERDMNNDLTQYEKNQQFDQEVRLKAAKSGKPKQKIPAPPPKPKPAPTLLDEDAPPREIKRRNRKKREITRCPHTDMKHYAKGMCNHCYHLYGRNSLANNCEHTDKLNYAKGMCQNCYFNSYNHSKRHLTSHTKSVDTECKGLNKRQEKQLEKSN
jgi:hypothetical protein